MSSNGLSFNPAFGLSAVLTQQMQALSKTVLGFNPAFGLSAVLTSILSTCPKRNEVFQSRVRA